MGSVLTDTLTDKQLAFCREYVVDWNGTQAAIRAGYSENTANVIASENLAKPYIRAEITRLVDEHLGSERDEVRAMVVKELKAIGRDGEKVPVAQRIRAMELLGKFGGLFVERVEHSGNVGVDLHAMPPSDRKALIARLLGKRGAD